MQHIAQTIETLRESARRVSETITFLEQFQSGVDGVTLPPPPTATTGLPPAAGEDRPAAVRQTSQKAEGRRQKQAVPRGTTKRADSPASDSAAAMYAAAAKLAEPFGPAQLAAAAGAPVKQAANFLNNRIAKGEFARAGRGRYQRGPKFRHRDLTATHNVLPRDGQVKPPTPVPAGSAAALDLDKPDTVAGAIKFLLRGESEFSTEVLLANLEADADFNKLLAEDGRVKVSKALSAWVANGHLVKRAGRGDDASYTITASGKEWFGA